MVDSNTEQPQFSSEWQNPGERDLADIPSVEVISRAAVMLLSASAERLGLADDDPENSPYRDLDEARRLITALAGLVTSSAEYLGAHAGPLREGLQSLQRAFREASVVPDEPGQGPGEKYTGRVPARPANDSGA
ncbi:recombinase RecA [Haloechinothrix sp. YIM 98757]|uniref:Recombinase RecA n=1 Tax=Haloechinothrix aidingensis TaxID=2752311 RepID=A0A838AFP5_9PSEU|nr:recombinase RecA [Haloechinothrix aidingensis]